ncbi:MAG: thioredoxin family protein [Candidatus Aminicenantes bacterium]|nr:thioredoxin family protein [Candidatus Aminicenantes bacterium]
MIFRKGQSLEKGKELKVICFNCGATNRLFEKDLTPGKKIFCGRCHQALPEPGEVLLLSPQRIYQLINNGSIPILLDFYSDNCPHCLRMKPILERLAKRRAGEIMVVRINVDHYPELAAGFGINSVPTFVIIKKGTEVDRLSGSQNEIDFSFWVASRT